MGRDVFSASHLTLDEHVQGATIRYKNETNATDMRGGWSSTAGTRDDLSSVGILVKGTFVLCDLAK